MNSNQHLFYIRTFFRTPNTRGFPEDEDAKPSREAEKAHKIHYNRKESQPKTVLTPRSAIYYCDTAQFPGKMNS